MKDVVVVGAGPGGAMAALALSRAGLGVLILERRALPRSKTCAGVLSPMTLSFLKDAGLDPGPVLRTRLDPVTYSISGRCPVRVPGTVGFTTHRAEADEWLCRQAVGEGAELQESLGARSIRPLEGGWEIATARGRVRSRALVGADGALSTVRRCLEWGRSRHRAGLALETCLPLPNREALVDFGDVPSGYAWAFPRGDHLTMGAVTFRGRVVDARRGLDRFQKRFFPENPVRKLKGHFLPLHPRPGQLGRGSAVLVGDAACLVDPLTGEGIYGALASGLFAATAIIRGLKAGRPGDIASDYEQVLAGLLAELRAASRIAALFYLFPGIWQRFLGPESAVARCFSGVLSGTISYRDVPGYLAGRGR